MHMEIDRLKSCYEAVARDRNRLFTFIVTPYGEVISDPIPLLFNNNLVADIVPGSFNPLHDAHRFMYDNCQNTESRYFELSISRINKPYLSFEELEERLKQFSSYANVWVTNASLFYEKAGLVRRGYYPVFNIGYDTAYRLIQHHGVSGVSGIKADFRVYRRTVDGKDLGFENLIKEFGDYPRNMFGNLKLPDAISSLSSTEIRAKNDRQ